MCAKKPLFFLPHHNYMKPWIKLETRYKPSQGSHLFGKGSFVTFDPANLEAIGNKHAHFLSNGIKGISDLGYSLSDKITGKHQTLNQFFVHKGVVNFNIQ